MRAAGRIIAATLLCLLICGTAHASRNTDTQKLLSSYVGKEPLRSGIVGVLAVRANGDTLCQYNRQLKMVPASNVKLITTGLALLYDDMPELTAKVTLSGGGSVQIGDISVNF